MAKRFFKKWYRSPRTTQERRANGRRTDNIPFVRAKRNAANLINAWDDRPHCVQKTWKEKRLTKYRVGKRGQKHELFFPSNEYGCWALTWTLEEYFEDHDIPFNIETIREVCHRQREIKRWVVKYRVPDYGWWYPHLQLRPGRKPVQRGWKDVGEWVGTGKYEPYSFSIITGYNVVWWSDKDIGIEHILNRVRR